MTIIQFRGKVPAGEVYDQAIIRITDAFRKVETDMGVIIPDGIRLFLSSTATESLYLHHEAWRLLNSATPSLTTTDPSNSAHALL